MRTRKVIAAWAAALCILPAAYGSELRGVIREVDVKNQEIVIDGKNHGLRGVPVLLAIDGNTQITIGKRSAALADLSAGKRVRVFYDTQNGKAVARSITILGSQPGEPTPPQPLIADANTIGGTLRRLAVTEREIVVATANDKDYGRTFIVPEDARIYRDQKPIHLEDLHEGEGVLVHVEHKDKEFLAKSIEAGTPLANAAKPKGKDRIERLRQLLKTLDTFLQMAQQGKSDISSR
jgi:hypothetical protein